MKIIIPESKTVSLNKINNDLKQFFNTTEHQVIEYSLSPPFGKDEIYIKHFLTQTHILKKVRKRILIQPIDGTEIKPHHVRTLNCWDLIVTPANVGKEIMIKNGVTKPIVVIPNYWEDDLLIDNGFFSKLFKEKKWTFYTQTSGMDRKNVNNILEHFIDEFGDEPGVRLVIKLEEQTKRLKIPPDLKCEIVIIDGLIPKENLNSLINGCDCYVCLSYMEGFCIPLLEAAVLKKDIICLDSKISGYTDFLNKDNSIMIKCSEIPIFDGISLAIFQKDSIWERADYEEYKSALRLSFNKQYKFNKSDSFENYHIDVIMESYLELID